MSYTFQTYIINGRETYLYGERRAFSPWETKSDFPFPESLMRLVYLDIGKLEPLFQKMDKALLSLFEYKESQYADVILSCLEDLASVHIYFRLLQLDWKQKLTQAAERKYENASMLLPRKQLSHIPSNLDTMQKQIKGLFAAVLDMDSKEPGTVSEKMVSYYRQKEKAPLSLFRFQPQSVGFELVGDCFTETLYPKDIYDLIDFHLRQCIRQEIRMRRCKNCGKFFAVTTRSSAEYCSHPFDEKGRSCKEIASILQWNRTKGEDAIYKAFRKEYKKRFARMKAGTLDANQFYQWSERAREKKAQCDRGEIGLDSFLRWLADI